jgi:MoaA/NifB/PqqE/SkfB family radical SAM enzyme
VSLAEINAFLATLADSSVRRIFLAGGEPLIWPPVFDVIKAIKNAHVQVVVCTNGIQLNRPEIAARIVDLGTDAVSVSLDSTDPAANDLYRSARHDAHGWDDVVTGIGALIKARGASRSPRVGVYTVITSRNVRQAYEMGQFAADLGCDYYVPQPVSLTADHPLHDELSLSSAHHAALTDTLDHLYKANLTLKLPPSDYPQRFVASITTDAGTVVDCFGGRDLFFIEPDGSVWDCPSSLKIAATSARRRRTIREQSAAALFTATARCTDCTFFSRDCVNMWPLMGFGDFALD